MDLAHAIHVLRRDIIIGSCFLGAAWVTAILSFYVRLRLLKFFGADDWAMVLALVSSLIFEDANRY